MLKLAAVLGIAFALQIVFSMIQMKHFSKEFVALRRKGKVACGRKSGGFHAGAIVMFRIDGEGIVQEAKKMEGVSCLARVKNLEGFEGKFVGALTGEQIPKSHRNLRKAVEDAALTYNKYVAGEEIETPPSPIRKAGNRLSSLIAR